MSKNNEIPQGGWNEYSKLVLSELERLNENDERLQETLNEINLKMSRLDSVERDIKSLGKWKHHMDNVASVDTLKEMKEDVATLNTFKTVAVTVWAVVQIGFGVFIALFKT